MEALINLCKKYIKVDIHNIINIILSRPENEKYIIELNQNQMHYEGVDSENKIIGYYTPNSYRMKVDKFGSDYPKTFTLLDTGASYNSMKLVLKKDYFIINGNFKKENRDWLQTNPEILGLTEKSLELLRDRITPLFIDEINKQLNE